MTHWDKQARQWSLLGPPLKPSQVDIHKCSSWINEKILSHKNPITVLILGVTPELVNIAWPINTTILAIDNSLLMLNSVLPKDTPNFKPLALAGNWLQIPLKNASVDMVIGDGCYSLLAEKDYKIMTKEIWRVLKPSGIFIMRFFSRPEKTESFEAIQNDIISNKINTFHSFKFRLAMSLHNALQQGVCLKNIWDNWNIHFKKMIQGCMHQLQWTDEVIGTIDIYKDTDVFYTFPTLQEIRRALCEKFNEQDIFVPDYHFGERYPTLKLIPIGSMHESNSI